MTASPPAASPITHRAPVHFAQAIFGRLGLYEPGVAASWFKLYGDRDPAGFFELMSA